MSTKNLIPGAKCTRCKDEDPVNHPFLCDKCLGKKVESPVATCIITSPGVDDFEFLAFLDGR